jgi:hypothetical protein
MGRVRGWPGIGMRSMSHFMNDMQVMSQKRRALQISAQNGRDLVLTNLVLTKERQSTPFFVTCIPDRSSTNNRRHGCDVTDFGGINGEDIVAEQNHVRQLARRD